MGGSANPSAALRWVTGQTARPWAARELAVNATPDNIAIYQASNTYDGSRSFVRDVVNGWIGESVGGVLMGLTGSDCAALNCSPSSVNATPDNIVIYQASNTTMLNNTFVRNDEGTIFQAIGGALIGIPTGADCTALNCGSNPVQIQDDMIQSYQSANPTIANNTFVRNDEGTIFQAIGGALIGIPTGYGLHGAQLRG